MNKQIAIKLAVFFVLGLCMHNTNYAASGIHEKSYGYSLSTPPDSLVVIVPNIFTPNGDGINDFWSMVVHDYGVAIIDLQATVYDRWGKEIFMTTNVRQVWNGHNLIGKACEEGTYFYVVTYTNGATNKKEAFKGFVELMR